MIPARITAAIVVALFSASIGLQAVRDRGDGAAQAGNPLLYIPSGKTLQRMSLSYDAIAADVYWIRAIQHYGSTKLSKEKGKQYNMLYPLLDITTTLDPQFSIAYRFGAIFLAEAYPNGLGRPDLSVALLKKGVSAQPEKWQYLQDIGFIYYWWLNDYNTAAEWFRRASEIPDSPWWLKSLAAATLAQGGERQASRFMWEKIGEAATENDWLRNEAHKRLLQLDALDQIDQLTPIVRETASRTGALPSAWNEVIGAGLLRGIPRDPAGHVYALAPDGSVTVATDSPLFPLPAEPPASMRPAAPITPSTR